MIIQQNISFNSIIIFNNDDGLIHVNVLILTALEKLHRDICTPVGIYFIPMIRWHAENIWNVPLKVLEFNLENVYEPCCLQTNFSPLISPSGRRMCLGESLARMELFLFFSTLLQHFCFTPPPGVKEEDLDLTPRVGLTLSPSEHKLCAIPCF